MPMENKSTRSDVKNQRSAAGGVRRQVSEDLAFEEATADAGAFLRRLERDGFDLVHGLRQTRIFDGPNPIGGIERRKRHFYLLDRSVRQGSETQLFELGFVEMHQRSGTAGDRRYFQIEASDSGIIAMGAALELLCAPVRTAT